MKIQDKFTLIGSLTALISTIIYGTWTIAQIDKKLAVAETINVYQEKDFDYINYRMQKIEDKVDKLSEKIK